MSWKFGEAPQCKPHHKTLRLYFGPDGDGSSLFEKQLDLAEATGLQKAAISKHVKACAAMAWSQRNPSRWLTPGSAPAGAFSG